jgi:hypothetical protein
MGVTGCLICMLVHARRPLQGSAQTEAEEAEEAAAEAAEAEAQPGGSWAAAEQQPGRSPEAGSSEAEEEEAASEGELWGAELEPPAAAAPVDKLSGAATGGLAGTSSRAGNASWAGEIAPRVGCTLSLFEANTSHPASCRECYRLSEGLPPGGARCCGAPHLAACPRPHP